MKNPVNRGGAALVLSGVSLPFVPHSPFSLTINRGERWHIEGDNGSGKSTLLKVMSGALAAREGAVTLSGSAIYLDQHFSLLKKAQSALEFLQHWNTGTTETLWRTRLAGLRLGADKILLPMRHLSHGEQMKIALLAVTDPDKSSELLLLDEPENFLDIDSRQLLETGLASWTGTLVVVSHDNTMTNALDITHVFDVPSLR